MRSIEIKPLFELANWLTLIRLPLAALLWMDPDNVTWILTIMFVAGVSDVVDGRYAKFMRARRIERGDDRQAVGRSHALGAWLDPLCDKTFVITTLSALYVGFRPPLWMLPAIAARELLLVPCALAYRLSPHLQRVFRFDFRAGTIGKLATVCQFCAIAWLLVDAPFMRVVAIATGIVGITAALFYLRKALKMARFVATNELAYAKWLDVQGLPDPLLRCRPGQPF